VTSALGGGFEHEDRRNIERARSVTRPVEKPPVTAGRRRHAGRPSCDLRLLPREESQRDVDATHLNADGNLLDLQGRIGLVTGAGQGVGREVALHFARHNAGGVVINDFHLERAQAVAGEVEGIGCPALAVACDVTDYEAVRAMHTDAEAAFGQVDILINNAGNAGADASIVDQRRFWETEPEDWQRWIGANFFGVLNCARAAVPGMMSRKYGRVITVTSDAGRVGEPRLAVYSGAKAGAAGFMRALAREAGQGNVTCNCVALSFIATPATDEVLEDGDLVNRMLRSYVIRRPGEPRDAANLILFLASDAASWVTGQTYPVNGGYALAV
jgi:2-hydroxycyclohexanecarboxyl-CoA dehydrogenase